MPLDAIKTLPVHELARGDCLLLLWTTGWAIATGQAQEVARAWGFKPISEIVWLKRYPSGKARVGTGYRVRTMHEPILVCTVGAPQHKPFPSRSMASRASTHASPMSSTISCLAIRRRPSGGPIDPAGRPVLDLRGGERAWQVRRRAGIARCWSSRGHAIVPSG